MIVEQLIRPTGLLDPIIDVKPTANQVDDLMEEIARCIEKKERVLVTTLTKRMAEELSEYLLRHGISTGYIHSDVDTLERVRIMEDLRKGVYDALIGVNLLREGLDLPEVSLVAILDADKEGFLRSHRSLTQTAGRAARHIHGRVIFYADKITDSMQLTMDETARRRAKQLAYNEAHGITPQQIVKNSAAIWGEGDVSALQSDTESGAYIEESSMVAADPLADYLSKPKLEALIASTKKQMLAAAKELDFLEAARLRDEAARLEKKLEQLTA